MLFNSWSFFAFFALVYLAYVVLTRRAQNLLLLLASWAFYAAWDWRFLSLLWISTGVDFWVARRIEQLDADGADERARRRALYLSLGVNLGILAFFKYFGFFVDSTVELLELFGVQAHRPSLEIVLPVGISFYTFQTMAYTIDVYRRRMRAVRDLELFALYVAYFPQLVAGPIERPQRLLPQLAAPRRVEPEMVTTGVLYIFLGLIRKVGIADVVAPMVDRIFASPQGDPSFTLLAGTLLFGIQIYADFSGYSLIARGLSRLLGIELMQNFRYPYFARNITDFWRRWHISLSSWLRDYLYIPLGGNRGSRLFTYRNLMLTMLLGGLWHGAAWTFVVWGGIHGLALALHKAYMEWRGVDRKAAPEAITWRGWPLAFASWLFTMVVVFVAWIFFRAESFGDAWAVLSGIFAFRGGWDFELGAWVLAMSGWIVLIDLPMARRNEVEAIFRWPFWLRGFVYAAFTLAALLLERSPDAAFIYFQF